MVAIQFHVPALALVHLDLYCIFPLNVATPSDILLTHTHTHTAKAINCFKSHTLCQRIIWMKKCAFASAGIARRTCLQLVTYECMAAIMYTCLNIKTCTQSQMCREAADGRRSWESWGSCRCQEGLPVPLSSETREAASTLSAWRNVGKEWKGQERRWTCVRLFELPMYTVLLMLLEILGYSES